MPSPTCYNHLGTNATAACADCSAAICADCTNMLRGQPFCPADYALMRREPAGAHLPTEVPAYQPLQYRQVQPTSIASIPVSSSSLLGSNLVSASPGLLRQTGRGSGAIARWAWVAIFCGVFGIIDSTATLRFSYYLPFEIRVAAMVLVPILAVMGLVIAIVVLTRRDRSSNPVLVERLGWLALMLNLLILVVSAYVIMLAWSFSMLY